MGKLVFVLFLIFMMTSCGEEGYWYFTVTNNSSRTVSFTFNGSPDELASLGTKEYQIRRGERLSTVGNVYAGSTHGFGMSVVLQRNTNDYVFVDRDPFNLSVMNTLPIEVTIISDYIDAGEGRTELTTPARTESSGFIYRSRANFNVLPAGYNITLYQNFYNNTLFITLR